MWDKCIVSHKDEASCTPTAALVPVAKTIEGKNIPKAPWWKRLPVIHAWYLFSCIDMAANGLAAPRQPKLTTHAAVLTCLPQRPVQMNRSHRPKISQNDPTWNQNRLSVLWVRTSTHFERPACHAARGKDMPLLLPQASGLNVDPTSDPLHGSNDSATQVVWEHDCPACPSLPQRCRPTHPSNYYKSITVWSYMIRTII